MRKRIFHNPAVSAVLAVFIALGAILPTMPAPAKAATHTGATYFEDTDNWKGPGFAPGVGDGDIDYGDPRIKNGHSLYPIELSIMNVTQLPTESAYVLVRAYDVDEYKNGGGGEWDRVYFSGNPADLTLANQTPGTDWGSNGTAEWRKEFPQSKYVGALSGSNNIWNTSVLKVDNTSLVLGNNYVGVSIHHHPSAPNFNSGWVTEIDWIQLVVDGGAQDEAKITDATIKIEGGAAKIDTKFLPIVPGDYSMEINLIGKDAQDNEINLGTAKNLFPEKPAGTEVPWNDISLGTGLDPTKEYKVNIILFEDSGLNANHTDKTDPQKAQHMYSISTFDPVVQDINKLDLLNTPSIPFEATDFSSKYFKINGQANGANLNKVKIVTLPPAAQGKLQLNGTDDVALGQEIDASNLGSLTFLPEPNFHGIASFKWNGYDGTKYALMDADVNITVNARPVANPVVKEALQGNTVNLPAADFTSKFVDPDPSDTLKQIKFELPPSAQGQLLLGTTPVVDNQLYPISVLTNLTFVPDPAFEGDKVEFDWYADDGKHTSTSAGTVTINYDIKPVVKHIAKVGTQYEPTAMTENDFRNQFYKPGGSTLNSAALENVRIDVLPTSGKLQLDGVDVTAGQVIPASDLAKLKYVPDPTTGLVGSTTFKWNANDDRNYAAASADFTISANPAPSVDPIVKEVDKGDSPITFQSTDFSGKYTDPTPGTPLLEVKLTDVPAGGKLKLGNTPVTEGQVIPAAQLGNLQYEPATGETGTVTFKWNGSDGSQYAKTPAAVTIQINAPPVAGLIEKAGLTNEIISFTAADFSTSPGFTDPDAGDTLVNARITLPNDFDSKGKLYYAGVTDAVYVNQGTITMLTPAQLDTLKFAPSASLPNGSTVSFPWVASDGKLNSEQPGSVQISYNGIPVVSPLIVEMEEGEPSPIITLQGTDDSVTGIVYSILQDPTKGTLTLVPGTNNQYTYTPNAGVTGADSFKYIATEDAAGGQSSAPATVEIRVHKTLEGWVGYSEPGNPVTFKALPDEALDLHAISTIWADRVVANVQGTNIDLTLANPTTYAADGFKRWTNTTTKLPVSTTPGSYAVSFSAFPVANQPALAQEPTDKLADNAFVVLKTNLELTANPEKILGDGKTTTQLFAKVTTEHGDPIAGVEVEFTLPAGLYPGTIVGSNRAITDADGIAIVTYKSDKISGTAELFNVIQAKVHDVSKGLSAEDNITITFQPAKIEGKLTQGFGSESKPITDARVTITLDLNGDGMIDPNVDFVQDVPVEADGSYSVAVPYGSETYDLNVTRTVEVGGVPTEITYVQKAKSDQITGNGDTFPSEKTASGLILFKQPDGTTSMLSDDIRDNTVVYLKDAAGNYISEGGKKKAFPLGEKGKSGIPSVFNADGLVAGEEYELEISYILETGVEIVMGRGTVSVSGNGEMNINQELVDPYGTVTDAVTNKVIEGAEVKLYYADTQRNRNKGRTPDTGVTLPVLTGFAPNDNASPTQLTDAHGFYAYMVYPETDYYLVVTKNGYHSYRSQTIPVEWDIVKHDLKLNPYTPIYIPPAKPDLALTVSVDRNLVEEGSQSTITVDYKNQGNTNLPKGQVSITIPEGVKIVDADGGTVTGNIITWNVSNVETKKGDSFKVIVEWPQLDKAENAFDIAGVFSNGGGDSAAAANAKSSAKIQVFSKRFDDLKHQRYILGFPDGEFKPNKSLTRAELAAIVARLTENVKQTTVSPYSDVAEDHWAANYIKIATKHKYFGGYGDGTFRPEAAVSRGELATVMARYLKLDASAAADPHFADAAGHWASDTVEALYSGHFLSGYQDGTFRPDAAIIRVEAVTMINRMLFRGPLKGLEPLFPDMPTTHWGFGEVQEATISHEAERNADGSETWTKSLEDGVQ
ncbi:S-layer homology domain-containing protein [Paenibacillus chungangensis]|uniref:S-layer homology domain-containing protein n=1 Tax=Paenibacillus chungangensis TaxID=696535 RepID=A0ABW3HU21_9BACL